MGSLSFDFDTKLIKADVAYNFTNPYLGHKQITDNLYQFISRFLGVAKWAVAL